ncbi:sulfatase, partial [Rhodopirellula maiorica SM1]
MNERKMIVISVEGLAASALGCYGASWNETPAIDLIASRGCLWDRAIAEHDDGLKVLADWIRPPASHDPDHWIPRWNELGAVELVTDDPRLSQQSLDDDFDQSWLIELDPPDAETLPAEELEETHLASLFASLFSRIEDPDPAAVWWLHTQSLVKCWDAPRWLVPLDADELSAGEPSEELDLLPETDMEFDEAECEMPPWVFPDVVPPQVTLTERSHPDLAVAW